MIEAMNKLFSEKVRLTIYLVVALGVMVFAAIKGSDGDWWEAFGSLFVALQAVMSASKVHTAPDPAQIQE